MRSRALLWALLAIVLWGTLAAAVGDALAGLPPAALLFWAFLFAGLALLAIEAVRGRLRVALRASPAVMALGLWGIFGYHALFFEALSWAPLVEANLLNYLWPLLMVLLAPLLARETVSPLALGGAAVGFLGAALVVTQGRTLHLESGAALGYLLAAGAALAWSTFSLLLKRLGPPAQGKMSLFVCEALLAAFLLAAARGQLHPPPHRALLAAAWLGIGPMALAFVCWDAAMASGNAGRIGALSYLDPFLSTACLTLFLGKPVSAPSVAGMILIVAGAALPALLPYGTRRVP